MSKSVPLLLSLAILSGCTWQEVPATSTRSGTVEVYLDQNGKITAAGWVLTKDDMPAFAKRVGTTPVVVKGVQGSSFSNAVEVQEELKAAGVGVVTIEGIGR